MSLLRALVVNQAVLKRDLPNSQDEDNGKKKGKSRKEGGPREPKSFLNVETNNPNTLVRAMK